MKRTSQFEVTNTGFLISIFDMQLSNRMQRFHLLDAASQLSIFKPQC